MSHEQKRNREALPNIVVTRVRADEECVMPVLPPRLLRGIREALDAGRGKLRMDPQELANRLGKLIDLEVERLARIRARLAEKSHTARMLAQPEKYFGRVGQRGILADTPTPPLDEEEYRL